MANNEQKNISKISFEDNMKIISINERFSLGINVKESMIQIIDFEEDVLRKSKEYKMDFKTIDEANKSKFYQLILEFSEMNILPIDNDNRRCFEGKLQQSFIDALAFYNEYPESNRIDEVLLINLNTDTINRNSVINAQIVGEAELQAIPKSVIFYCRDCQQKYEWKLETDVRNIFNLDEQEKEKCLNLLQLLINTNRGKLIDVLKKKADDYLIFSCNENTNGKHRPSVEISGNVELQTIFIKDVINNETRDLKADVGKAIKTYLIGKKTNGIRKSKLFGVFVVDIKDSNIRPIIFHNEPLTDELHNFSLTNQDKQDFQIFRNLTDDIIDETVASNVVGRTLAKKAALLTFHSVLEFNYRNEQCNGLIRTLFYGDTKTCKSTIMQSLIKTINLGEFLEGETSGRTGIAYTIDNDTKTVIWGSLVYNDLGFVAIDGFQQLKGNEIAQLREVFEKGYIKVRRFASGEALARVRIIASANPKKNMEPYIYKCEAITPRSINYEEGFKPFHSTPDVTRWHIFIPFSTEDVEEEEFLTKNFQKRAEEKDNGIKREKINDSVLRRHILWAWSRTSEQIIFTDDALRSMLNESVRIQKEFSYSELPIVHNGFHEVIARISVAYACMYHSTDNNHENVIVDLSHVKKTIEFIETMFTRLDLSSYIYAKKHNTVILDDEEREIIDLLGDSTNRQILEALAIKGTCSSKVLAEICNKSEETIKKNRLPKLQAKNLIESKRGVGNSITDKGIQAVKKYIKKSNESEEKNNSNSLSLDGDLKIIYEKISELNNENCTWIILQNTLPKISGLHSKLQLLKNQQLISEIKGSWRVL
ncbi:MAG: hypothetical protein ACTSWZ_05860 [Candidatus Heimdallarchaeaceae archaeon]